jgi:MFS family permease
VQRFRDVSSSAWRSLIAAQVGWMLDAMDFLLFTFALRSIQQEFGLASRTMGLLTTVALISAAVGGIGFGRLADRIGRVRAMTISIILFSVATAGLATASSLWQLIFWRLLVGLGMGGEWSSGSVLVAESWPPEHRAKAVGIMQSGWAIGALIAAGLSALFLERYGWRTLFLFGLFPAVIAVIIRRTVPEPEIWRLRDTTAKRPPFLAIFAPALRKRTIDASLVAASVLVAYWGLMTWLPAFLAAPVSEGGVGLTVTKSATWTILIQIGAFLGYVSFGWFADRRGRRMTFTLFMIAAAITVPTYALAASRPSLLLVLGPLVGFFAHGYFSLFGALLSELFPTDLRATAQGFCYNVGRLASAAAPYLIGFAAESVGLGLALALNSLFFAVAGALVWLLPETKGADLLRIGAKDEAPA